MGKGAGKRARGKGRVISMSKALAERNVGEQAKRAKHLSDEALLKEVRESLYMKTGPRLSDLVIEGRAKANEEEEERLHV